MEATSEQKTWFIKGAQARSQECGCSACRRQFQQALTESNLFTEIEITAALEQHPS